MFVFVASTYSITLFLPSLLTKIFACPPTNSFCNKSSEQSANCAQMRWIILSCFGPTRYWIVISICLKSDASFTSSGHSFQSTVNWVDPFKLVGFPHFWPFCQISTWSNCPSYCTSLESMVNVTGPGPLPEVCWVKFPKRMNNIARIEGILGEICAV